ncbi:MAG: circularly permuted type 2 ATP-grasp protein, partial [Gammaproteobacteria bacterium]|nr:circularly permuted type 2 ATP-grasp protein [Gammaproteobacteria bacterium]
MTATGLGQLGGLPEQSFWQPQSEAQLLSDWVAGQSVTDLTQLHQQLQHELRENGSDGEPWQSGSRTLDCTPWLISDTEWQQLECGLAQRHRLLAAVVADLYGPQQLLHNNVLPADLLYLSGNYLLPVCGLLSEPSAWLPLLSADVGRNAAGEFCVLDDFSQLPDGLGYLLEHRLAFNHCGSQLPALQKAQLAGFFRQLLQVLQQPALSQASALHTSVQTADRSSLVGLLAPVAKNAGYFEQAFLANYLDIALVHGADLMFKDGRLWLKTLTGLQPVASLLRYLAD